MNCPDENDLMDLWLGQVSDPELEAHAEACPECIETLALLADIREAFNPQVEVPDELNRRTLARLERVLAEERKRSIQWNTLGSGILGGLTVAAALALAVGGPSPTAIPLALVAGTMAGLAQLKWPEERRFRP